MVIALPELGSTTVWPELAVSRFTDVSTFGTCA
jgi:hypothetical protein